LELQWKEEERKPKHENDAFDNEEIIEEKLYAWVYFLKWHREQCARNPDLSTSLIGML